MLAFIGLATNALLARLLTPAELGAYFLVYSVVPLCTQLGTMGLTSTTVRLVAESVGLEQYSRARRAIKLALSFGSLGAIMVGMVYLIFGGQLASSLFNSPALAAVAGVTTGWIVITVVRGIMAEAFRGFHDIQKAIILGGEANGNGLLAGALLSLLLLLLWVFRGETELITVLLLAVVSGSVSALLAGFLLRHKVTSLPRDNTSVKLQISEMMHVAWPLMVTALALLVLSQSSMWIAGIFLGQEEVALYGVAYRLMLYVAVPLQIANMVAAPMIAEMYAQGRSVELQRALRAIATTAGVPALLLLLAFVLFGTPIIGLIFGDYYHEAAVPLALLSLGQIANVWAGACGQALMMTGYQTTMMVISVAAGLLMVAGAVWGVQNYGVIGIAAAAAGSLILQNIVTLLVVRNKLGIWTHAGLYGVISARKFVR